jgi:hypothetical protein
MGTLNLSQTKEKLTLTLEGEMRRTQGQMGRPLTMTGSVKRIPTKLESPPRVQVTFKGSEDDADNRAKTKSLAMKGGLTREEEENLAAIRIQKRVRGHQARKKTKAMHKKPGKRTMKLRTASRTHMALIQKVIPLGPERSLHQVSVLYERESQVLRYIAQDLKSLGRKLEITEDVSHILAEVKGHADPETDFTVKALIHADQTVNKLTLEQGRLSFGLSEAALSELKLKASEEEKARDAAAKAAAEREADLRAREHELKLERERMELAVRQRELEMKAETERLEIEMKVKQEAMKLEAQRLELELKMRELEMREREEKRRLEMAGELERERQQKEKLERERQERELEARLQVEREKELARTRELERKLEKERAEAAAQAERERLKQKELEERLARDQEKAAKIIQKHERGHKARRDVEKMKEDATTVVLNHAYESEGHIVRMKLRKAYKKDEYFVSYSDECHFKSVENERIPDEITSKMTNKPKAPFILSHVRNRSGAARDLVCCSVCFIPVR